MFDPFALTVVDYLCAAPAAGTSDAGALGDAIISGCDAAGVSVAVLSARWPRHPSPMPAASGREINSALAEASARHPGRLYGLASIDPFRGRQAAEELRHAVEELGLRGARIDLLRGSLDLSAEAAVPFLEEAGGVGLPILVDGGPDGGANARALIAMARLGIFERFPALTMVVQARDLRQSSLHQLFDHHGLRGRIHVCLSRLDIATVAQFAATVGPENLVLGSDGIEESQLDLDAAGTALTAAGLSSLHRAEILGINAIVLLRGAPPRPAAPALKETREERASRAWSLWRGSE